jgi:hypothetical protein
VLHLLAKLVIWTGVVGAVVGLVVGTDRTTDGETSVFHDPLVTWAGIGFLVVCWALWALLRAAALHTEVVAMRMRPPAAAAPPTVLR